MKLRIITAVVGLAIFIPLLVIGGIWLQLAISVLAIVGVYEFYNMRGNQLLSFEGVVTSIATLSIIWARTSVLVIAESIDLFSIFFLCVLVLMIYTIYQPEKFSINDVSYSVLGALYIGGGFSGITFVRSLGFYMVVYVFLIIWGTDTFAYLAGRKFGKHQLAPKISPNKTIEGSIGGVLGSIILSYILLAIQNPVNFGFLEQVFVVAAISIFAQMGDLVESAYKRHFGVKDSGNFLPGHGGVLDRFDSTFFAMFAFQIVLGLIQ